MERKLATILAASVVGYTRMASIDTRLDDPEKCV